MMPSYRYQIAEACTPTESGAFRRPYGNVFFQEMTE